MIFWPNGGPATLAEAQQCVGAGWAALIEECYNALPDGSTIHQVKEKYGGLRFYCEPCPPMIAEIEDRSETVCEDCGAQGEPRRTPRGAEYGWIRTLCDGCWE